MNSIIVFLLGCIPVRILLAYISTKLSQEQLKYLGVVLLGISLSFMYLYFTNKRLDAPEAGGKTWWSSLRPIHGVLYLAAAIYAFKGETTMVWIPLIIDVIFGFIVFSIHHFKF